jgi:hypothetical protein
VVNVADGASQDDLNSAAVVGIEQLELTREWTIVVRLDVSVQADRENGLSDGMTSSVCGRRAGVDACAVNMMTVGWQ